MMQEAVLSVGSSLHNHMKEKNPCLVTRKLLTRMLVTMAGTKRMEANEAHVKNNAHHETFSGLSPNSGLPPQLLSYDGEIHPTNFCS